MIYLLQSPRYQRLAKEGIWIVAGQIAAALGALMLVRLLTDYLEPAKYGELALGLTIAGLVHQVVMGGVTGGILRFYSISAEKNDLPGYLYASRRLMGFATAVVLVIALVIITGLLWLDYSQWMGLAAAALALSMISGYNAALSNIQTAARQRAIVALHVGLDAWLKILLIIIFMVWLGHSSVTVLLGYSLSCLLVTGSQLFFLRKLIRFQGEKLNSTEKWVRQIWAYSWPFSVWGVFIWAQQVSDRWALQMFVSTQEVGLYAVAFQLGYVPIGLLTGMAVTFLSPILYQRSGDTADFTRNKWVHRIAWRITMVSIVVVITAFLFTFFNHEQIFHLLIDEKYYAASHLLPWMVLAGGFFSAGQVLSLKLMSEMKSSKMIAAKIITALIGVVLNFYGASQFGLQGVAAALVVFSVIYFLWMTWLAQHPPISINDHPGCDTAQGQRV
jgi:O-antigen/teichoic acid export membrane protein